MDMAVECESCHSRFRLNTSLLKQSKAVRFRCRKCGGFIMVRNPNPPAIPPDSTVPPNIDVEPPPPHKSPAPLPGDLVYFSPGKEVVLPKASTRRRPSPGRNLLVAGLSILLLAGGVLYFGTTKAGQGVLGDWFPSLGFAQKASASARPVYDVRELKPTAIEKTVAGNLFVVRGTVVNVGKGTSHGILMRAALIGVDNLVFMENSSLAGNLVDEPTLLRMDRTPIEVYLKMEHGEEEARDHREILPGMSLPFMVVFFDPPAKIGSFTVHAVDAD